MSSINPRASTDENLFVEIFQEAVGFAAVQSLQFQLPFEDVDGRSRYIDYALKAVDAKYAFEVDGEYFHLSPETYRDGLLRQNSLTCQGWRVYRWTDTQLRGERDRVVDQLRLFLEREITAGSLHAPDLLPPQEAAFFDLHEHQREALLALEQGRAGGKTIMLLTHATGTGKTHVAISDAKRLGYRTLYLAHTEKLPKQTAERFGDLWPEAHRCVYRPRENPDPSTATVVLATFQTMARNLSRFNPQEFGYIIVDEAHHAVADTFSEVIRYFRPRFLLGLTATPERSDDRSLMQLFQETAHRLTLEEAIQRKLLVPIRCFRVDTNIDLHHIRFNGVDYRIADLEKLVSVPGRDDLIADIYIRHAMGKRAVCFCVSVDHAERVASLFKKRGIRADSVSGRLGTSQRESVLASYERGETKVLCACDMLNEGWDSPCTEVLLMARPTLSKILYVQQLGRGTRTAPGKECLLVFDFVDKADRYAQALNLHRLFGRDKYRPGSLVAAPAEELQAEERMYESGVTPPVVLGMNIYDVALRPIDVFSWQDAAAQMVGLSDLAQALRVDDDTIRQRIRREEIVPDLRVPAGEREYCFFHHERVKELQERYAVVSPTEENIRDLFMEFVAAGEMSASYKPVLVLGMLDLADASGRASVRDLVRYFRDFYAARARQGLLVESPTIKMARIAELDDIEVERTMLAMPFEKFERKKFFRRLKDLAYVRFVETLWRKLSAQDKEKLRALAQDQLNRYYARLIERPQDG